MLDIAWVFGRSAPRLRSDVRPLAVLNDEPVRRRVPFVLTISPALAARRFEVVEVWIDANGTHLGYEVDDDPALRWPYPDMEGVDDEGRDYFSHGGAASPS